MKQNKRPLMTQMSYHFLTSLLMISLTIGIVDALIMVLLKTYQNGGYLLSEAQEITMSTLLLVLITAPILWFVALRPLVVQIAREQETTLEKNRLNAELHSALDAHSLVSITNEKGMIIYANDNFCQVSGYSLDELVGKNHNIVNSGHHDKDYIRTMWETIKQGRIWQGVFCNRHKNGELYWVESTIMPLLDETGKPFQYISIRQDITAKKLAQEEQIKLKRAVDACSEMIIISNKKGIIQYVNPAFCQFTGWMENALKGQPSNILDNTKANKQTLAEMAERLYNNKSWSGHLLQRRKGAVPFQIAGQTTPPDPLEFWVDVSITPVLDYNGAITGYVQIQRDITEQISKETTLQIANDDTAARLAIFEVLHKNVALQESFNQVLDILFELKAFNLQRKGGVFLRNDGNDYLEMFTLRGQFSEEFIRREKRINFGDCLCGRAAVSHELLVSDDCFCDPRHEHTFEGMNAHGHYIVPLSVAEECLGVLFLYTDPYPAQNEARLAMLKQVGDMLAMAILQEQAKTSLENARDIAMQTASAKSDFLANMSHEIRTPMNGVLGMLDLMRDTNMTPHQWDLVNTAYGAAEALLTILNDILDFSKLESGKLEIETINFNLVELVEDVCGLLGRQAFNKGLELSYFIPFNIPKHWQGDPNRIRQVLTNLIGNALKFTERGEVSLTVTPKTDAAGARILRFEVRDTGVGIAPEAQAHLFQPFSQAESSTARRFGGTGLGLSISKNLIALMGGVIGLDSTLGQGSCFWFNLPLLAGKETDTYSPVLDHQGKRILIVDDSATNRLILHHYLTHWGFEVEQADNGRAALCALEKATAENILYHLVLLDMQMPEMDGLTLARILSKNPILSKIPRILLSSGGLLGETERQELGLSQSLLKPVKQSQLFDAITYALSSSEQRSPIKVKAEMHITSYLGKKLLVAEDNKVNQKVILGILEKFQIFPDVADNGQLALEKLAENSYDLILMDCQMPVLDGYQTTQELRKFENEFGLPHQNVVALTAHIMSGEKEKCLAAGMDDYLTKPISQSHLAKTLAHWLGSDTQKIIPAAILENTSELLWDKNVTLDYFAGDEALLNTAMTAFIDETPAQLLELQTALDSHNLPALADLAHGLKGVVSLFSASSAMEYATRLELTARSGDPNEDYQQMTAVLIQTINRLIENFRFFCKYL